MTELQGFVPRLRLKYRDPANLPVKKNGIYRTRTGNSNGISKKPPTQGTGQRRRLGK